MVNGTAVPVCEVEHLESMEWLQPEPLGGGTTLGLKLLRDQMVELAFRSGGRVDKERAVLGAWETGGPLSHCRIIV